MVTKGDLVVSSRVINQFGQPAKLQGVVLGQSFKSTEPNYNKWYTVQFFTGELASLPETALTVISHNGNDDGEEGNL